MSAQPLAGLVVVDLSRNLPGPLAAQLLASLGARVLKVEEPGLGDPVRLAPPRRDGRGALASLLLSGVESIALDLKKPAAREVLESLLAGADVLLETFRPGGLARLGFDPAALQERHPRLVICSLSGFGKDGPSAHRAGHDLTYQALAGTLAPSPEQMPALPVADLVGAWSAVAAILAALLERQASSRGACIDASLFDAAVHSNLVAWSAEVGSPQPLGAPLLFSGALPCYNLYRTADGHPLALAALEPHFWRRFCRVAGRKDLERLHLSRDPAARQAVAEVIASRTRAEWQEVAAAHDLPLEPVLSAAEAAAHPQAAARDLLRHDPRALPHLAFPARFDGERPRAGDSLPDLGEHTQALLAERGLRARRLALRSGVGKRFSLRRLLARWLAPDPR